MSEEIMPKKYPDVKPGDVKPGIELDLGQIGVAATQWEGRGDIDADYSDCTVAIEPCGEDVFELWLHSAGQQSICLLADKNVFAKLGRALSCLLDSRDLVSKGGGE